MKNGDVINLYEALQRISENKDLKFSVVTGYILAKNKEILRQEAIIIYDLRRKIIMEHGELEGKDITVPKEYVNEVNKKIDELMNIENNVKIDFLSIEAFENCEMNMEDIEGLIPMLYPVVWTGPAIVEN